MTPFDRLTLVFYLLMRDAVPTGTIVRALQQMHEVGAQSGRAKFSSPELEALAARYAGEVLES